MLQVMVFRGAEDKEMLLSDCDCSAPVNILEICSHWRERVEGKVKSKTWPAALSSDTLESVTDPWIGCHYSLSRASYCS